MIVSMKTNRRVPASEAGITDGDGEGGGNDDYICTNVAALMETSIARPIVQWSCDSSQTGTKTIGIAA